MPTQPRTERMTDILFLRRRLMMQRQDEPQPVAIQGDGTAYISLTDIIRTDKFRFVFEHLGWGGSNKGYDRYVYLGYQDGTHYNMVNAYSYDQGSKTRFQYGSASSEGRSLIGLHTVITLENYAGGNWYACNFTVNGTVRLGNALIGTGITTYSYQLVRLGKAYANLYSFRVYSGNSDTLKHDLVPAVSNGEAGLRDTVTGIFYGNTNPGGGTLTAVYD